MLVTIDTDSHGPYTSSRLFYDHMETFIDYESSEGCVVINSKADGDVRYESDKLTENQWNELVQLDREMTETVSNYIQRAIQILEGKEV